MINRLYIKHYVNDMDASMVQRCILCGEIISDYRHASWLMSDGPPKGYAAGSVFVSKGQPTISTIILPAGEMVKDCKDL